MAMLYENLYTLVGLLERVVETKAGYKEIIVT